MTEQSASAQKLMLQELINHFFSYINMIPGTTTDKSDTSGHGEAGHRKKLKEDQVKGNKLRTTSVNGLLDVSELPEAYGKKEKKILSENHLDLVKEAYPIMTFNFGGKF